MAKEEKKFEENIQELEKIINEMRGDSDSLFGWGPCPVGPAPTPLFRSHGFCLCRAWRAEGCFARLVFPTVNWIIVLKCRWPSPIPLSCAAFLRCRTA